MRVGFGTESLSCSLGFTDRNQMKTRQNLLAESESIWGWEVTRTVHVVGKSWRPARTSTGRSCFHSTFWVIKPFPLPGGRLDSSMTTCCCLELWPGALGTDTYLRDRREVCAYQHQPASTSLFPQNGCFQPGTYSRSSDWNVGTQVFPPKLILLFQDTLYNHGLEFVIDKCGIKLCKIRFF